MGLSFTPLPRYQFFLIAEYIEVTFATSPHTQDLLVLFTPAWHHAAKFLQQLPALVSALHEVDNKTLANNLAAIANQVLFSAILNPALPKDTRLQAQNVLCELSAASISTTSTSTRLLFIQRFSPPCSSSSTLSAQRATSSPSTPRATSSPGSPATSPTPISSGHGPSGTRAAPPPP